MIGHENLYLAYLKLGKNKMHMRGEIVVVPVLNRTSLYSIELSRRQVNNPTERIPAVSDKLLAKQFRKERLCEMCLQKTL